jgi:hypothetical protein
MYIVAACAVGSDIYVFGGCDTDRQSQSSVFKFDTEANAWSILPSIPDASTGHTASVLDGLVYIIGGGLSDHDDKILRFDPVSHGWSTLVPTSCDRRCGASFVLGGHLYATGGAEEPSSVQRYDLASDTWNAVVDMLEGRRFFSAVTIGSSGPAEEQDLFDSLIARASGHRP